MSAVHHPIEIPVGTDQDPVVHPFDAGLAHQVPGGRGDELLQQQLGGGHFANVAEEVAGGGPERIVTGGHELDTNAREITAPRLEESRFREGNPGPDHRRPPGGASFQLRPRRFRNVEASEPVQFTKTAGIGEQPEGGSAASQHATVAVQHESARRPATLRLQVVVPGHVPEFVAANDLELPEPGRQQNHEHPQWVARQRQAPAGSREVVRSVHRDIPGVAPGVRLTYSTRVTGGQRLRWRAGRGRSSRKTTAPYRTVTGIPSVARPNSRPDSLPGSD